MHLFTTPLNIFFSKLGPRGAIPKIENIEEQESFGVSKFEEFSWKRRLDFDACVECGRCQDACPAYLSGSALNPKAVIVKLKRYMLDGDTRPLHGEVIAADELWACTTCMACVEECPAHIDIVDTIVDLRRHLTLSEGTLPSTAPMTLQNMERAGNPWGLAPSQRLDWAEGLDVPVLTPGTPVEYLYWVGCSASYDRRNQNIARSMVKILKAAGVSFGVMAEERCHGEVARRLGNEYLYQMLAEENVGHIKQYQFQKVVTHCPHCFNTIRNEYPQFQGTFEVVHHSVLIRQLLQEGRLSLTGRGEQTVAFHDSCYLGRYNGIFEAPRQAAASVPGLRLIELPRSGPRGLCCGGGGGQMWMETPAKKRVNVIRIEEVVAAKPDVVAVACPFCLAMLDLGRKVVGVEEQLAVKDISELVAESLEPSRAPRRTAGPPMRRARGLRELVRALPRLARMVVLAAPRPVGAPRGQDRDGRRGGVSGKPGRPGAGVHPAAGVSRRRAARRGGDRRPPERPRPVGAAALLAGERRSPWRRRRRWPDAWRPGCPTGSRPASSRGGVSERTASPAPGRGGEMGEVICPLEPPRPKRSPPSSGVAWSPPVRLHCSLWLAAKATSRDRRAARGSRRSRRHPRPPHSISRWIGQPGPPGFVIGHPNG